MRLKTSEFYVILKVQGNFEYQHMVFLIQAIPATFRDFGLYVIWTTLFLINILFASLDIQFLIQKEAHEENGDILVSLLGRVQKTMQAMFKKDKGLPVDIYLNFLSTIKIVSGNKSYNDSLELRLE